MPRWKSMSSAFARAQTASLARHAIRRVESGAAESVEFIFFAPTLMLLVTLITIATSVRAAQVSLWSASRECARVASSVANAARGSALGARVGMRSLEASGVRLASARVDVTHPGAPGGVATCTVRYAVDISMLPMARLIGPSDSADAVLQLTSSYALQVESYRSHE